MANYRVFQYGILDGDIVPFEYGYPVDACCEEHALNEIVNDQEIINDDFLNCPPNGVTWSSDGWAQPMHLARVEGA